MSYDDGFVDGTNLCIKIIEDSPNLQIAMIRMQALLNQLKERRINKMFKVRSMPPSH